ncbi:MAG: DUF4469 domain-containing protein [Spirochaetaceae bacterium]|nr:DUF4469 domain-containing protein [Spirochaetaceae bacterium]
MLEVYMTRNHFPNSKKKYSFRSRSSKIYTQEELVDRIANANTTLTKPDVIAVFTEMERQFNHILDNGDGVKLFMGSFHPGVSGTAEEATEHFSPKPRQSKNAVKRDHKISLLFEVNDSYRKKYLSIPFKYLGLAKLCTARIRVVQRADLADRTTISPSDSIEIKGSYLKLDPNDAEQGVFLTKSQDPKKYRLNEYSRCTRITVTARIPSDIPPGDYSIFVRTDKHGTPNIMKITITD